MSEVAPPGPDELMTEGGGDGATSGVGPDTDNPVLNGLLSTEPDQSIPGLQRDMGLEPPFAHGLAGVKKFINGVIGANLGRGTTALEHFVMAAIGIAVQGDGGGGSDNGEPDEDRAGEVNPSDIDLGDVEPEAL